MNKFYTLILFFFISLTPLTANTIYVDLNAMFGLNNGSSWADAYTDLQEAIDVAIAGDEIWVAKGTYLPTVAFNPGSFGGTVLRKRTFYISTDGIEIYGGFVGTEANLIDRDVTANPTLLSGDFNGDDSTTGTSGTSSFTLTNNTENAYHVVYIDGTTTNGNITVATILDGFQITGGNADIVFSTHLNGGGLFNDGAGSGNASNPSIVNCSFSQNTAYNGGGVYNRSFAGQSSPVFTNCTFSQNSAQNGGGVYNKGQFGQSDPTFFNCAFSQNVVSSRGGGVFNDGASGQCNPTFTGCTFSLNNANNGAGVYSSGGSGQCNPTLTNCIIWGDGTGTSQMYNLSATGTMSYCIYEDNNIHNALNLPNGMTDGGNNLEIDPRFVNPANGNLNLDLCSPALDSGNNTANTTTTDLAGNPRVQEGIINRGAYETLAGIVPTQLYVDKDATTGANTGLSWADAYTDLQSALNITHICGSGISIWVAEGTYYPTENNPNSFLFNSSRRNIFYINTDGTKIYGGFNGTETLLSQRDIAMNVTTLSGDFNGDDSTTGTPGTSSFALTNNTENAYHVVYIDGTTARGPITAATILDGFQITGGQANGNPSNKTTSGGGLFNNGAGNGNACSPSIIACTFSLNNATFGGGVHNDGEDGQSDPTFANCTFFQNTASSGGGGIYNNGENGQSNPTFANCSFSLNNASSGGGVLNNGENGQSNPTFANCSFSLNNASYRGGGVYNNGENGQSDPTFANCSFSLNNASNYGGGVHNEGEDGQSDPTFTNCSFSQNNAYRGGGAYNDGENGQSNPTFTNCTFSQNNASSHGAGIYNSGGSGQSNPTFTNCIIWGDGTGASQMYNLSATGTMSYCIYEDNNIHNALNLPNGMTDGGNNLGTDPRFVNPTNGNLNLNLCSPALDSGNNTANTTTTDLAGNPRVQEGIINRGAYETLAGIVPTQLYVDKDATTGANTGLSWADAYTDLQSALSITHICGGGITIWVAEGTYYPTQNNLGSLLVNNNRGNTFYINTDGTKIYGGFNGTETLLSQRDVATNLTTLSGDFNGDDSTTGTPGTSSFALTNNTENAYHVVYIDGTTTSGPITAATILDGFQITGGQANGSPSHKTTNGGGLFNNGAGNGNACSPSITDCTFSLNNATVGGGVHNDGEDGQSDPTFANCTFFQNTASSGGGGIYNNGDSGQSNPTFANCTFSQNKASSGGGIHSNGDSGQSNPTFANCSFSLNNASYRGGGVYNNGENGQSNPTFANCSFSLNNATFFGGGVYNNGDSGESNPTLTNCIFAQNTASNDGGGMYNSGAYNGHSNSTLTNCSFAQNTASKGGGIYNFGAYSGDNNPTITNCSFAQNTALQGGGIYNRGTSGSCNPMIQNCIFWNATAVNHVIYNNNATGTLSYSIYDDAILDGNISLPTGMGNGGNNLEIDPLFLDATNGDLKLMASSPAIDAGDDAANTTLTDLLGNPRIQSTIDMGAYEYTPPPVITTNPISQVICVGANTSFSTMASGVNLVYQWQEDTGAGFMNITNGSIYSGASTNTLQLTNPSTTLNNVQYQCIVTGSGYTLTSTTASLTFSSSPSITTQPISVSGLCSGDNTSFTVISNQTNSTYQWQVNLGSGFLDMSNASIYSGVTSSTLIINGVISGLNSYQYRCVVTNCSTNLTSNTVNLNVNTSPLTMDALATYTAVLNPNKTASVSLNDLLNTPLAHPCGIVSQNISGTSSYTCLNVGNTYPVTITALAGNGQSATATVMVSVTDPNDYCCAAPQAFCNSTIPLSLTSSSVTLDPASVLASSIVPCGIQSVSLSQSVFDCSHIGTSIPVTYTLTDNQNQATTCNTTVVVTDGADPTAMCVAPFDIYLDAMGNASITTAMINNGSTDNCTATGDLIIGISQTDFDCTDEGITHTITLTVEDEAGRMSICTTMVTVLGNAAETVATRSLSVADVTIMEGDAGSTLLDFTVSLTGQVVCTPITVDYATSDSTATAGTDYVAQSGTLTFAQGETSKIVSVVVNGDVLDENVSENIQFILTNPMNVILGMDTAIGTIMDDDVAPTISITSMESVDEAIASAMGSFTVTLAQASGLPISIFYYTTDGTATAGMDYTETNGTIDIPAGSLTGTINIPITDDMDLEGDETFTITLDNPANVMLSTDIVSVVTIVDNESADSDTDGIIDVLEPLFAPMCNYVVGVDNSNLDCDGDNINDATEIANGTDPLSEDTDNDGVLDNVDPNPTNSDDPTPNASNCKVSKITVLTPTPVCVPATGTYPMNLRIRHKNANQSAFNKLKIVADNGSTTETFLFPVQTGTGNINQIVNLDLVADGQTLTFYASFIFDEKCDKSIIFAAVPGACSGSTGPICSVNSTVLLLNTGVNAAAGTSYSTVSVTTDITAGSIGVFSYNWATTGYVRFSVLGDGELSVVYEPTASWTVTITDETTQCVSIVTSNGLANVPNVGGILDIVDILVNAPLCDSANGAITVEADEGSGDYEFIWSTGFVDTDDDNDSKSTLTGLTKGWYEVIVMDVVTNESTSEWVWVPCSNNAGGIRGKADLTQEILSTTITPNPFEQATTISLQSKASQTVQVNILRLNGQVVAELFRGRIEANTIQPLRFEADHLHQGLYLLQIIDEQGNVYTDKLILQR